MELYRIRQRMRGVGLGLVCLVACGRFSQSTARASVHQMGRQSIARIDANDTAAYAIMGPEALAAVARCRPPGCRPDIFRGPGPGELTVGLDSARATEFQWHREADTPPLGGQVYQDSSWSAMLSHWERSVPKPLLLVDGTPRTYAYAREHVNLSSVWGVREVSQTEAKAMSSDPSAANGAVVIVTKAHAPPVSR